jgi:hypothetical protein
MPLVFFYYFRNSRIIDLEWTLRTVGICRYKKNSGLNNKQFKSSEGFKNVIFNNTYEISKHFYDMT